MRGLDCHVAYAPRSDWTLVIARTRLPRRFAPRSDWTIVIARTRLPRRFAPRSDWTLVIASLSKTGVAISTYDLVLKFSATKSQFTKAKNPSR